MIDRENRFYLLDTLRGFAALSVVIWHWHHFFPEPPAPAQLPFYRPLHLFYTTGWAAVDFFFCLSGFIFYWLYADSVATRQISARQFFILRFSRLYPLHIATLVLVVAGQALFFSATDKFFVYQHNDGYHLILQVLFVQSLGLEAGYSFNGPAWSISVEALLYAVFFVACRFLGVGRVVILLSVAAAFLVFPHNHLVGRGLLSFFVGGAVYLAYAKLRHQSPSILMWLVLATFGAWTITLVQSTFQLVTISRPIIWLWVDCILAPASILALAMLEARGVRLRRLSFLGDISYSSYMLHFPLQLAFANGALCLALDASAFSTPWMLLLFIGVLLGLSWASYKFLERPTQSWLRFRFYKATPQRVNRFA